MRRIEEPRRGQTAGDYGGKVEPDDQPQADLSKIFLAKSNWPDGEPIVLVVRHPSSPDMQATLRDVIFSNSLALVP